MNLDLPPSLYEMHNLGVVHGKYGEELQFVAGLDRERVEQLMRYSLDGSDTELQKNTSDKKRFGSGGYETWFQKDRTPFALLSADGTLAALVWIGPDPLPQLDIPTAKEWATIAFRAYNPYRGKGLMKEFSRLAIEAYQAARPHQRLWLETNPDNEAGKGLYLKLGFQEIGLRKDNNRLVMVQGDQ